METFDDQDGFFRNAFELPVLTSTGEIIEEYFRQVGHGQHLASIDEHIVLRKLTAQHSLKYDAYFATYECKVRGLEKLSFIESINGVFEILDRILERVLDGVAPNDRVRIRLNSGILHNPIWTPPIPKSQLTTERLMLEVERVLQSYQHFRLDESFELWVQHVVTPVGGCEVSNNINILRQKLEKMRCVVPVRNNDDLCLPRAICIAKAIADGNPALAKQLYHTSQRTKSTDATLQTVRALKLLRKAGLPPRRCGLDDIPQFEAVLPQYMFVVIGVDQLNHIVYSGAEKEKKILLLMHDQHFDVLKSIKRWYHKNYWCFKCQKGYDKKHQHRCGVICQQCYEHSCSQDGDKIRCEDCLRSFFGPECFARHRQNGKDGLRPCEKFYICKTCFKYIAMPSRHKDDRYHRCGESFCRTCRLHLIPSTHHCFMQPQELSAKTMERHRKAKFLYFDFETYKSPMTGRLIPNLAVLQDDHGNSTTFPASTADIGNANVTEELCNYLFSARHGGCFVIAHNLRSFDGYFILNHLLKNNIVPQVTFKGSQLLQMDVRQYEMKFRDSLNYVPMSLTAWAKAFDVPEHKGFFPHETNTPENWGQMIPFPNRAAYGYANMKKKDRKTFMKFYRKERRKCKNVFDYNAEFVKYCKLDVTVLRLCCQKLRALFGSITDGLCPFSSALTIAGMCGFFWRAKLLQERQICLIPPQGFITAKRRSGKSHKWLCCEEEEQQISIKREVKVGRFYLDGFCAETNTAYEFFECFWHGCPQHNNPDTQHPVSGISMRELHAQTEVRVSQLEKLGLEVIIKWEHDFDKRCCEDEEYADLATTFTLEEPLRPRDAFYGGRTNAAKLYHKVSDAEKIHYLDFISLYPSINKYKRYPTGPVTVVTKNFQPLPTYFGLAKVRILPPTSLYLPLLPYRANGKLTFPLCRRCVDEQLDDECPHSRDDRCLTGTWCTIEILKAVELGYKIQKIFEVWHYPTSEEGLFAGYIDTFLKLKTEASGFPDGVATDEQIKSYIQSFQDKEGVKLDREKIAKNPGMRTFAKLCLNSFWGRLGMQDARLSTVFITEPHKLHDYLLSGKYKVQSLDLLTDDVMQVTYNTEAEYLETNVKTNVVLAAFTTAWARLKLYDAMAPLGKDLLYYDTDSVIFVSKADEVKLMTGSCLGDLSSELAADEYITEIVCLAPKCYAYRTNKGHHVIKVKGFTLNGQSRKSLKFETLLRLLSNPTDAEAITYPFNITKDKKQLELFITSITKRLRFVYDKRRILYPSYETLPFGYRSP